MPIRQNKNSHLILIGAPYAWGEIPGVMVFGYDPQRKVERWGFVPADTGPVLVNSSYEGVTGSFGVEGSDGEKAVLAYAARQSISSFVSYCSSVNLPIYLVAKTFDDDGVTPIGCDFIDTAKLGGMKRGVNSDVVSFPFEAKDYVEVFGKEIVVKEFPGSATLVTSLPFTTTAQALTDKNGSAYYALSVLRQTSGSTLVTRLRKAAAAAAGYYSETSSGITLAAAAGLAVADKALAIYVKA